MIQRWCETERGGNCYNMKRSVFFVVAVLLFGLGFGSGYGLRAIGNAWLEAGMQEYMATVEREAVTIVNSFIDLAVAKGRWLDAINRYMHPVVRETFAQAYVESGGRQSVAQNQAVDVKAVQLVGVDFETGVITVRADYTIYRTLGSYREPIQRSVTNFLLQYATEDDLVIIGIQDLCGLNSDLCRI